MNYAPQSKKRNIHINRWIKVMNNITKDSETNATATLWCVRHTQRWSWMSVLSGFVFFTLKPLVRQLKRCFFDSQAPQRTQKHASEWQKPQCLLGKRAFGRIFVFTCQLDRRTMSRHTYLHKYICVCACHMDAATPCCMLLIACLRRHFIINQPPF